MYSSFFLKVWISLSIICKWTFALTWAPSFPYLHIFIYWCSLPTPLRVNIITECPLCNLKKEVSDEVDFLDADKHWSFLPVDFNTCSIKVPTRWYYQYWWTWSSILKVLEIIGLQYLHIILKKKLGMVFIFCMQIKIKVSTSWQYHFWRKRPEMPEVTKKGKW